MAKGKGVSLDRDNFFAFALKLEIATKEKGIIPLSPTSTQVYLVDRLIDGLRRGIHCFKILKCRQAMCSTICLAFDLYWSFKFPGITGSIITDDGNRMAEFRKLVGDMVRSLPDDPDWRQPIQDDNRYLISFANRSSLRFWNANSRESGASGKLGRGVGVNLIHGSECGFWKNQNALESIAASMAEDYEHRLYLWESTANGFNVWTKMCEIAQTAVTQELIFIGWWLHDYYQLPEPKDPRFRTYWDGRINDDEARRAEAVYRRFGVRLGPERIAWYRWKLHEEFFGNEETMFQEYPWLPEDSFRYQGGAFVSPTALNNHRLQAQTDSRSARYFRFKFGTQIQETEIIEVEGVEDYYDLCIWAPPADAMPGVVYVMGVDPSYGSNETSDQAVIQILRCYADRVEQVAEFSMRGLPTYQLTFACIVMASAYQVSTFNLELQGGGIVVMQEIQRIQQDGGFGYANPLTKHFMRLQHFLYRRPDTMASSASALHTKSTTADIRETNLNRFRDLFERELIVIRSIPLIEELSTMVRDPDSGEIVPRNKADPDDRSMSIGFAVQAFWDVEYYNLSGTVYTWEYFQNERTLADNRIVTEQDLLQQRVNAFIRGLRYQGQREDAFRRG